MTTNTQNWRKLANTRQWIINNLSRKLQGLEAENAELRRRLGEDT